MVAAAAVVLVALLAGGGYWYMQRPDFEPADPAKMEYALGDKPSIAVLAFDNLTGDPEQEHVSDGISEDIISTLARLPGVQVIARNSTFSYKGAPVDVRRIAEELSVQYVLEGSLQAFGEKVRITAQLIDATSGRHVWSKTFDRPRADFFDIRDEITREIVSELNAQLVAGDYWYREREANTSLENWLLLRKSVWHYYRYTAADNRISIDLAEKMLANDPNSVQAHVRLSIARAFSARVGWIDDKEGTFRQAEEDARRAIELGEGESDGYFALSFVLYSKGHVTEAIEHGEKALRLAPGDPQTMALLGLYYQKDMQIDRALDLFARAIRADRKARAWVWENYAESLLIAGRYSEAIPIYMKGLEQNAEGFLRSEIHIGLAASYDALGRDSEAREQIAQAIVALPEMSVTFLRRLYPYKDEAYKERFLATLKRLGLPEE